MPWIIPSFKRGLVDKASRSKLTDDYKTRCAELTNMYITKEDSIRIRPPAVLEDIEIPTGADILDYQILADDTVVHIRSMAPEDIANMSAEERQVFFRYTPDSTYTVRDRSVNTQNALKVATSHGTVDPVGRQFGSILEAVEYLLAPEAGQAVGRAFRRVLQVQTSSTQTENCVGILQYKAYKLFVDEDQYDVFIQRLVPDSGDPNECIDYNAMTREGTEILDSINSDVSIVQSQKFIDTVIAVDGEYGQDSNSKMPFSERPLSKLATELDINTVAVPLRVDWDNPITSMELYRNEITFNFANQNLKINTDKELVNLDSDTLITSITSEHELESKLIPTEKQLWELTDLPIKIIEIEAPKISYQLLSPGTSIATDLGSGVDDPGNFEYSGGLDTRNRGAAENGLGLTNAVDRQDNFSYILGSGPYAVNSTYELWGSKHPWGFIELIHLELMQMCLL